MSHLKQSQTFTWKHCSEDSDYLFYQNFLDNNATVKTNNK